mmetsp:Transcript_15670/g.18855  ORF Transcript_15670/g.18855 Transcript_15670/m.18855 type:complete len:81 (+) Transcript_15670:49-291(+)
MTMLHHVQLPRMTFYHVTSSSLDCCTVDTGGSERSTTLVYKLCEIGVRKVIGILDLLPSQGIWHIGLAPHHAHPQARPPQ